MGLVRTFRRAEQGAERWIDPWDSEIKRVELNGETFVQININRGPHCAERGKRSKYIRLDRGAFAELVQFGNQTFESET